MATNPLKFYKGWYGKSNGNALPANLPDVSTAIIFNEEEGVLYLNGKRYGGATDVIFTDGVLTITYSDGRTPISLDFNDTASASETMKVFEQIANLIGENIMNGGETLNYSGTNYLAGESSDSDDDAKSLVEADRILDSEIKKVNTRIDGLDTQSDVHSVVYTAASGNDGAKLTFAGVSQTDGQVAQGSGTTELQFAKVATTGAAGDVSYVNTTSGLNATDVQTAIDILDSRLDDVQTVDVFDTVVPKDAAHTPNSVSDGELQPSADTMHKIYLVEPESGEGVPTGTYNEWITVRTDVNSDSEFEYEWELIGSTQADLTGYVKTIVVNGKTYSVSTDNTVTLTDVITGITGESTDLNNTDYINVKATTTKNTTDGTNVTVLESSVQVVNIADVTDSNNNGLATALDVKNTIETLDADFTGNNAVSDTNNNVTVSLSENNGVIDSLGVNVTYATVTYGDNGNSDATLTATDGILLGSDVSKFADFTNTRIGEEIAKLDATATSEQFDSDSEPVQVTVTQENGLVSTVQVATLGANVDFVGGGSEPEDITISNLNGIVLGRDILELKDYIDAKASDSATVVTNSNGQNDALVLESTNTNGKMTYDINLCWTQFEGQPENTENNGN